MSTRQRMSLHGLVTASALILGSATVSAHDVYLRAETFSKPLPGIAAPGLTMWGYSACDATFTTCGAPSSPGPEISVPAGDSVLRIHLQNKLTGPGAEATSVYIPGQPKALNPHRNADDRIDSFDSQTAIDATVPYEWTGLRSGTYLYQSGSHVQLQVQMGLYGAMTHDVVCSAAPCAYAGVPYGVSRTLVYSEVDPALHSPPRAVNAMARSADGGYAPRYFLINGESYPTNALASLAPTTGQRTLLRLLNAGLENHSPELLGGYFSVVASDGAPAPTSRQQYNVLLPAAKTLDLLLVPVQVGNYSLLDRRLRLVNDDTSGGGMLAKFSVTAPLLPVATADAYQLPGESIAPLVVALPGVLGNDINPGITPLTAAVVTQPTKGVLALAADGSFTYTPASVAAAVGQDVFTYTASSGALTSSPANVTIDFIAPNHAPVAVADAPFFITNNTANITANAVSVPVTFVGSVLGNDTDPDAGNVLSVASVSALTLSGNFGTPTFAVDQGVGANAGKVTFNYPNNWVGLAAFNYGVLDNGVPALSSATTVTDYVVRDIAIRSAQTQITNVFPLSIQWQVAFRARTASTAITYQLVPSRSATASGSAICTASGSVAATITVPANTPASTVHALSSLVASTNAARNARAGCDTLTVRTAPATNVPASSGVPAHSATTGVTAALLLDQFSVFASNP
jgi:FtsP/CotA-like multicopper oxidase with cupredoxin domain